MCLTSNVATFSRSAVQLLAKDMLEPKICTSIDIQQLPCMENKIAEAAYPILQFACRQNALYPNRVIPFEVGQTSVRVNPPESAQMVLVQYYGSS